MKDDDLKACLELFDKLDASMLARIKEAEPVMFAGVMADMAGIYVWEAMDNDERENDTAA